MGCRIMRFRGSRWIHRGSSSTYRDIDTCEKHEKDDFSAKKVSAEWRTFKHFCIVGFRVFYVSKMGGFGPPMEVEIPWVGDHDMTRYHGFQGLWGLPGMVGFHHIP